ncbi:uncharacterized protein F4812DRAFT_467151 [Daldinia caldariorum]|uniref:uncharacterized protein n=1 Tax=Daldinia caldariorum TaxID=326644 RepID=UPI00200729BC|nr:uncharacterized protein F4812DRAFT_467151 [Daldinia caldariorum]KAI1464561.1 hypothetical protein F4812DRAFT_467151 [Daldinia caldariorum]
MARSSQNRERIERINRINNSRSLERVNIALGYPFPSQYDLYQYLGTGAVRPHFDEYVEDFLNDNPFTRTPLPSEIQDSLAFSVSALSPDCYVYTKADYAARCVFKIIYYDEHCLGNRLFMNESKTGPFHLNRRLFCAWEIFRYLKVRYEEEMFRLTEDCVGYKERATPSQESGKTSGNT